MEAHPPEPPEPEGRSAEQSAQAFLRKVRSMLPVSPLPWHWQSRLARAAVVAVAIAVVAWAVASVVLQGDSSSEPGEIQKLEASPQVRQILNGMSLTDRASQVIAEGVVDPAVAEKDLEAAELGGIVVRPNAWPGGSSGPAMIARLRAAGASGGRVPPLVMTEQEGGVYRALADLPPDQREVDVGDTGSATAAESWAAQTGIALKQAGIDLNLAPVADVATLDSPVADRAFGDDPATVTELTAPAVRGCATAGIACAVSHFPGLGGASGDTEDGPATVSLDAASLAARDLEPFRAAFQAHVPAVVLSLAFYAAYDPVTPGALSSTIATDLLRSRLGFEGVAITDDLASGAISAGIGAPEAAVQALAAGADLVVVSDPALAQQARQAIIVGAESGSISKERLDQAAARVLALKRQLGLVS